MADRVKFVVSAVPIEAAPVTVDQGSKTLDMIATEVGKAVSGSGEAAVTDYSGTLVNQGYKDGAVGYKSATGASPIAVSTGTVAAKFVFIKNTGYKYSSPTVLGDALDESLKVVVNTKVIGILKSGEAIVLKDDNGGIDATGITVQTVTNAGAASANNLALEFLVVA